MDKFSNEEKKWRAMSDAETMAQYEEIMSDKNRRTAAIKAAKEKANDLNRRANAMNKVAGASKGTSSKAKKK